MRGLGPRHGRPETLDESDTRERAERYQQGESDRDQRRDSLVHGMTRVGSASSAPLDGAEGRAVPTAGRRAGARMATHPLSAHRARDLSRWALWGSPSPGGRAAVSRPGARQLYLELRGECSKACEASVTTNGAPASARLPRTTLR